jgi:hypothetical protein
MCVVGGMYIEHNIKKKFFWIFLVYFFEVVPELSEYAVSTRLWDFLYI